MQRAISRRVAQVQPSPTLSITMRAREMKQQGIEVIGFGAGEPDFDTPAHIKWAAAQALAEGETKYPPTNGFPSLREAICEKLRRDNGLTYHPDEVLVCCGAKHALYNTFQAILDPGDRVLLPCPYWVSYPEQIQLAGGEAVVLPTQASTGFKITPEQLARALQKHAPVRALLLNSPSNPTGEVYSREELQALAEVLRSYPEVYLVSDEIYEKILYEGAEHVSLAALGEEFKERTFIINGVSKAYAMTGWRIGYVAGPGEVIAAMKRLQDHSTSGATSIAQRAAEAALRGDQSCVAEMVAAFAQRRQYIVEQLNALPGITCRWPAGAFYVFPDVSGLLTPELPQADALAEAWLETVHVAVVPGTGFGAPTHVRFSYATSLENLEKGLERLAKWMEGQ
ncbi:MAG TPA: pyridoxal phosphate-dependent aminotransferase [Armatimonadetes bacterium]|nr:pyridoxal phosphate-dependent aminotransferase [Armatimonadota bacterium]